MKGRGENPFRSKLFRKLFISYAVLIVILVVGCCFWYWYTYTDHYRTVARENVRQQAMSFANETDRVLLTSQSLCAAMNSSETIRGLYQTLLIEKKTPDAMQLYRVQTEMNRIKASSGSMDIYAILLGFTGGTKLYAPGQVIALESLVPALPGSPWAEMTNAVSLLKLQGVSNIILNKEYLIFAENYTGSSPGLNRGFVMVLTEPAALRNRADSLTDLLGRIEIRNGSRMIFETGTEKPEAEWIEISSLAENAFSYRMQMAEHALDVPTPLAALFPMGFMLLGGLAFLQVYYLYLKRRYHPIGTITRMVAQDDPQKQNDLDQVVQGISDLIGERNGYREKMITIAPYASHGALHQLISGELEEAQLNVLREEEFWGLRGGGYQVGLVNLAAPLPAGAKEQRYLDARTLAAHACAELSAENQTVVTSPRDAQNLFVVVSGENGAPPADLFYTLLRRMEEAIDDPDMAVTIGVSRPQTELDQLRVACREAARALENMLTGGRGNVFFAEGDQTEAKAYDLPRDMQQQLVRALRENRPDEINSLLDRVWENNIRRADLAPETVRSMLEEMYLCINGALREVSEQSVIHLRAERPRDPATIEEIFGYYRSLLMEANRAYQTEVAEDRGGRTLETEILAYIDEHILSPDLSLSAVADHFGVSGKMVGTVCRNAHGMNYLQYVRDAQVRHAAKLLQTTDLSLEDIAAQCGFTNVLTFRRNFKAAMNVNPSDYRNS